MTAIFDKPKKVDTKKLIITSSKNIGFGTALLKSKFTLKIGEVFTREKSDMVMAWAEEFKKQVHHQAIKEVLERVRLNKMNSNPIVGDNERFPELMALLNTTNTGIIEGYNLAVFDLEAKITELKKKEAK